MERKQLKRKMQPNLKQNRININFYQLVILIVQEGVEVRTLEVDRKRPKRILLLKK